MKKLDTSPSSFSLAVSGSPRSTPQSISPRRVHSSNMLSKSLQPKSMLQQSGKKPKEIIAGFMKLSSPGRSESKRVIMERTEAEKEEEKAEFWNNVCYV